MSELPMSAEERLAALERKVSMMWNGGGDLLGTEGYLQIGTSTTQGSQRFDSEGHQIVNNTGVDIPGVYFVPFMRPDPDSTTPYSTLEGYANVVAANEDVAAIAIRAQAESGISATIGAQTFNLVDGLSTARLATVAGTLSASALLGAAHNAALATFTLDNASLVFDSFAADPGTPTAGMAWFNSSDAVLRYYDGSNTIDLTGGGGGMTVKVKEADETLTTNTTLQDDNELLFAVAANEVWQFEGTLLVDVPAAADFKMTFTGPAGAVGSWGARYFADNAGLDAEAAPLGTSGTLLGTGVGQVVQFWGGIHNAGTAGNLTLQWAQDTSSGTTTVYAGSYIKFVQADN